MMMICLDIYFIYLIRNESNLLKEIKEFKEET